MREGKEKKTDMRKERKRKREIARNERMEGSKK